MSFFDLNFETPNGRRLLQGSPAVVRELPSRANFDISKAWEGVGGYDTCIRRGGVSQTKSTLRVRPFTGATCGLTHTTCQCIPPSQTGFLRMGI